MLRIHKNVTIFLQKSFSYFVRSHISFGTRGVGMGKHRKSPRNRKNCCRKLVLGILQRYILYGKKQFLKNFRHNAPSFALKFLNFPCLVENIHQICYIQFAHKLQSIFCKIRKNLHPQSRSFFCILDNFVEVFDKFLG